LPLSAGGDGLWVSWKILVIPIETNELLLQIRLVRKASKSGSKSFKDMLG